MSTQPTSTAAASSLTVAMSARQMQIDIRSALVRDVARLWPLLDASRLDTTFPGWVRAMTLLVKSYRGQSAAAAAAAYRVARQDATQSPAPRSLVKFAPDPEPDWLIRAFGFSGPGTLNKDVARPNTALTVTMGTASRIVLDAGRTTIIDTVAADPVAVGWYRVTDGKPCAFCALLASRGVVYKKNSFDRSNAHFAGDGTAKVHNDCGCGFSPAFTHDVTLPGISDSALSVYRDATSGVKNADRMATFRKAWAAHLAARG